MDLRDSLQEPAYLYRLGFVREDESSTDFIRDVVFVRTLQSAKSQLRLSLQVRYELYISDEPRASYSDSHEYVFVGAYLAVSDRRLAIDAFGDFDEESELPREIGEWRLKCSTLSEIAAFSSILGK
jgi:hypothetical protein